MQPSENGYIPVAGFLADTVKNMPEFHRPEMPEFVINEYDSLIDSSDMTPAHWMQIARDIKANYQQYDGFIILHGTDTMAYTASALSFIFEGLSKPVIVTGSQIPLAELRSDGQTNLLNALYVAANYPIPEVSLFFNNKLLRGNRSRKTDADGFNAFTSPNFPMLLEAGINIDILAGELAEPNNKAVQLKEIIPQPVGVITLYPGVSELVLRNTLKQPVKALILLSYGVGNAPQNAAVLKELKSAYDNQILVVNCTQCVHGRVNMQGYATGKALQDVGVVSGMDMTPEAALAKLHFLLSQNVDFEESRQLMSTDIRGELTEF